MFPAIRATAPPFLDCFPVLLYHSVDTFTERILDYETCLLYTSETGKRHPTIGNNVMISAGAKIIGSFTVGDNSKIGAGSVVIEEVPPNCTVVGVPGRVVKRDNIRTPQDDMDQVHLPDPAHGSPVQHSHAAAR